MKNTKTFLVAMMAVMAFLAISSQAVAQQDTAISADSVKKWDFHLSMGSSLASGPFSTASLFAVTPSFDCRVHERLTVSCAVSVIDSWSFAPEGYSLRGETPRSMAPLRHPRSHTVGAVHVEASYMASDRLSISASLTHIGGDIASAALVNPWILDGCPAALDATALSASMRYKFGDNNYFDLHMTFINDRTGALGPLCFGSQYGSPFYYDAYSLGGHLW